MSKEEEEEVYMPQTVVDHGGTELYGELHGEEAKLKAEDLFNTPTSGRWAPKALQAVKVEDVVRVAETQLQEAPDTVRRLVLVLGGVVLAYSVYRVAKRGYELFSVQ